MLEVELQGDTLTGTVHEEEAPFLFHIYFLAGVKIPAEVLMRF